MAGMFYSLQEVVEKLQKTEEEIKQIVREGRLREFRDGPNLLFKVDEVESLMVETKITAPKEPPAPEPVMEELPTVEPPEPVMEELPTAEPPAPEPVMEELPTAEPPALEPVMEELPTAEPPAPAPEPAMPEPPAAEEPVEEEEISLVPESTEEVLAASGLTSADTAITDIDKEIDVLSEAGRDYQPADDTMGETRVTSDETALAGTGEMPLGSSLGESPLISSGSGEASLEEIEGDVNLDSFGSGSGLLDLSLQADDTSLGGILDEIYTPEGEEGAEAGEASAAASAMEAAAESGGILAEVSQPSLGPVPMAKAYIEPEPDVLSNAFGYMLILPLLAVIYASIIVVAGQRGLIPSVLAPIQKWIWYIMGGLAAVSLVVIGIPIIQSAGGAKAGAKPKAKKEKKPKKPKAKKEKKPKKQKKPKK